ncbi:DNA-processing protein DprA [Pseudofrancisella aestuarii]|uniref:DNA-processing protein DprA n=1 Tax=Pseudofrancisella aestuarii TaxID=2670347 RepID=A0ABV9TCW1_9GAMM|nr:DNA-processing protein DprA [Pseudofrancisella aestuarii]
MEKLTQSCIILSITPYFGNKIFKQAIVDKIDLEKLITTPNEFTSTLKLRKETIDFLEKKTYLNYLVKVEKWLTNPINKIIHFFDDDYPENLKETHSPPIILYCIGDTYLLKKTQISIVGSRNNTIYGDNCTKKLVSELVNHGFTITSGLAYGIDTLAHKYTLKNNGKTIAVLGTGIDIIYPAINENLANQIIASGLIVSEFAFGTTPQRYNFPQRNRIISGLSTGVLIIEATEKSGSLITAKYALEQNKEVFAVPGSIFSKASTGCNNLIKQGAKSVTSIEDILNELNIDSQNIENTNKSDNITNLSKSETIILNSISMELTTIDQIINSTSFEFQQVNEILFDLEMESLIKSVPGGYVRVSAL